MGCGKKLLNVESYHHTGWLQEQDFRFVFTNNTPKITLKNLIKQVASFCIKPMNEQLENADGFMEYFRSMRMSRSYKPVLVLAAIQCGGTISLEKAAQQFIRFYQGRADRGQPTEKGYCVYCDKEASLSKVYYNLVNMPIAALCSSGYFTYDSITRTFSFADNLYDSLSLEEIDEIESICKMRLSKYFNKISSK